MAQDNALHWHTILARFFENAGLRETLAGFERDLVVLNSVHEQETIHPLMKKLSLALSDAHNSGLDVSSDRLDVNNDDRRLFYTSASASGTQTVTPTSLNKSISEMIATNRARSLRSNTREFLRPNKRPRADSNAAGDCNSMDTSDDSRSARTSTVKVDRDVQMKFDTAKNPDGPLGRTILSKSSVVQPCDGPGQGTGGVLSQRLLSALASGSPTMARHPGLKERYDNLESHLAISWVPAPPEELTLRLRLLEEHIVQLEREYPPWASIHFQQPNRLIDREANDFRLNKIIVPSHLTISEQPSRTIPPTTSATLPSTNGKRSRQSRDSTLLKAVMDKAEVARAMRETSSTPGAGSSKS